MIITLSISGLLLFALIFGKINLSIQFNKKVKKLFAESEIVTPRTFKYSQLLGLPEPVQRYFRYVLKEEQPYISYVKLTHAGQFKTGKDKKWIDIKGEEYFTVSTPGYIWKGTTAMFTARDMYISGEGRLIVSLLSLINVVDGKGKQYDQGELLRWLSESVLFPTNLLPSEKLEWIPIDKNNAKLTFDYKGMSLFFIVTISDIGEITQMETERYMDKEKLETWVVKMTDYKEMNKVKIPTSVEVLWKLEKGDFSYARFNGIDIVYDDSLLLRKFKSPV